VRIVCVWDYLSLHVEVHMIVDVVGVGVHPRKDKSGEVAYLNCVVHGVAKNGLRGLEVERIWCDPAIARSAREGQRYELQYEIAGVQNGRASAKLVAIKPYKTA
jgi:hypothetical protein